VVGALIQKVKQLPRGLLLSLTWDRGTELAMHKLFSRETGVPVYFCDPRALGREERNENTNGLLRQYFPSGLALSTYSQHDLDVIALRLNNRHGRHLDSSRHELESPVLFQRPAEPPAAFFAKETT